MADPRYGSGGGGFDETLARMNQQAAARDELARKEATRASVEEQTAGRSTGAITENISVRERAVGATERLSSALKGSAAALDIETAALRSNTQAWERRASAAGGVSSVAASRSRSAVAEPAFIGPVESPQLANARYQDALRAQAAAELQATQARSAVSSAQRTAGTTPEALAPLIAQREAANAAVLSARGQSKAAADNVGAQQRAAAQQDASTRAAAAENARLEAAYAQHAAAEREAAVAAQAAAAQARRQASTYQRSVIAGGRQLGGGGQLLLGPGARLSGGPSSLVADAPVARNFIAGPAGGAGRVAGAGDEFTRTEEVANRNAGALERMAGAQGNVNRAVQQSIAQYGASSQALQRHGALTSEFIQAFARGEVTLQEFSSQMLTTIGKFGGWAIAGAAVYGVVDALKHLADGAKEAQSGYTQLTRFIPNVSQGQAQQTFTSISTELNVPIKDVVDAMTIMARTFKTLPEAALAARAALLASRLDQIAPTASAPYLVGISQAFGLSGGGTLKVVDSLNALQREYGARVAQTLPGLAKAAPAALAAGVDQHTLEALIGVGVRAGFSGSQVATAVARSATTFVQKPQDQALLESYGFNPNQSYSKLIRSISQTISERDKAGNPISGKELRDLSIGLAGPQLGSRTFAGILARGGLINQFAQTAANPGETASQERQKQLGAISEQVSSIGIGIENFGATLSSSGVLIPLQALLTVLQQAGGAANTLISPLASIGSALGGLPGPLKEILGAVALLAGAQAAYRSTFGKTAAGALGQIPGLSFLDSPNAQTVRGLLRTQTTGLEFAKNQQERSSYGAAQAYQGYNRAFQARQGFEIPVEQRPALGTPERQVYEDQLAHYIQAEVDAERKAIAAQEAYLTDLNTTRDFQARIVVLKSKELNDLQKVTSGAGLAVTPAGSPTTSPVLTTERARLAELERNAALTPQARSRAMIDQAKGGNAPLAADALAGVSDEAIAAQALRTAEAERPGFIAGKLQSVAAKTGASGNLAGTLAGFAAGGLGASRPVGIADRAITGASGLGSSLVAGVPGALGAAFTGILAGQLANSIIPGAAGNFVGSAVTGGSLGIGGASLLSSVLSRYGVSGVSPLAGFAVGAGASALSSSNPITNLVGGAAVGGGIGAILTKVLTSLGPEGAVAPELAVPLGLAGAAYVGIHALTGNASISGGPRFTPAQLAQGAPRLPSATAALDNPQLLSQYARAANTYRSQQAQIGSLGSINLNDNQVESFGQVFAQQLTDAFTKTGQDAKTALTTINRRVAVLASNVSTFGLDSATGSQSAKLLQEAGGQAVLQAGRDPQNVDQYIQITQKADQALQQGRDQTYQLANARAKSGQDRAKALNDLIAAENAGIASEYTDRIPALQQNVATLSTRYNDLLAQRAREQAAGNPKAAAATTRRLNSVGTAINDSRGGISVLQERANQLRQTNLLQNAPQQAQVYSSIGSDIAARQQLAEAAAGSDKLAQLRAQLAGGQSDLTNAARNLTLNPQTQKDDTEQIKAKLIQVRSAIAVELLARADSYQKLQEAMVPLNVPFASIDQTIADAQKNLKTEQANPRAFSVEQVNATRTAIVQAQRARAQEGLTNVQAGGALAQSNIPTFDPVAVASGALANATAAAAYIQAHASNFKYADILNALAAVNSARQAVADAIHQNQTAMATAQGAIASARDYGNVVAQAQDAINTAAAQLALARTPLERAQATGALIAAQNGYNQALIQHTKNQTDYAASLTNDPVEKARIQLQGAQRELSQAKGPDAKLTAAANVNNLKQAYQQSLIQQRQGTVDFQLNMQQITTQQAIQQLNDLLKLKGITLQNRQSILQRIRQLQLTDNTGGQFDLAPGNIKLPTPYDVRRALRSVIGTQARAASEAVAQGGANGSTGRTGSSGRAPQRGVHDIRSVLHGGGGGYSFGSVDARSYFAINVRHAGDVKAVGDAIDKAAGTRIASRARAARIG